MQDGARFFAYSTWAVMISLAIMIFSYQFLGLTESSVTALFIWGLVFGAMYCNITYSAIKRYIKKVPAPTKSYIALAVLIFIPPALWMGMVGDFIAARDLVILAFLAAGVYLGMTIGHKQGIKVRYEYIQQLKRHQAKQQTQS